MAIIPLRQYNREIEGMIEGGQSVEAIAHCRHILQFYPKHIQTYRLLGKIHLENQQYSDAIDIFQRLLAVVPDDFIAHAGMSIIREDENNLDAAIWHMERAFETQPSNSAIQEELRRLYGRRDGMEPPKIRLTRGALARMYTRGSLYEQAIAELRAALSEDPQRVDLQVLLAQMYYHTRQYVESIDICSLILKKYPYCMEANRLLVAILPETQRAGDIEVYRQRILAMDPYYASASPYAQTTEDVPENAVTIERLDYRPGLPGTASTNQPAWASSLGINFEQETSEKLPEWLQESESAALGSGEGIGSRAVSPSSQPEPKDQPIEPAPPSDEANEIPAWMKDAGWEPLSPDTIEEMLPFTTEKGDDEIAVGEIPDWLKEMAPAGALDDRLPPVEDSSGEPDLPWLKEKTPGASDTIRNWLEETRPREPETESIGTVPEDESGAFPDWLREEPTEPGQLTDESIPPSGDEKLPAWLIDLDKPQEEPSGVTDWLRSAELPEELLPTAAIPSELGAEPTQESELPDWLQESPPAQPEMISSLEEAAPEDLSDEIPAWLQGLESVGAEPLAATESLEKPLPELEDEDAALAWLENLAAQQGASEAELITRPEERLDLPPAWIREQAAADKLIEESPPASTLDDIPAWLQDLRPVEDLTKLDETAIPAGEVAESVEVPDWLRAMQEPDQPKAGEPADERVDADVALPDWLQESQETAPAPTFTAEETPTSRELPDLSDQDAALAWLESLAAQHGAKEEELITKPEDRLETPPDWILSQVEETSEEIRVPEIPTELPTWLQDEPVEAAAETPVEPAPETFIEAAPIEELPTWLQDEPVEAAPETRIEATPIEELPAWLQDEPVEAAAETPVEPAPETPVEAAPIEELPAWLLEEPVELAPESPIETAPIEELPTWLPEEPVEAAPATSVEPAPIEELPTWLLEEPVELAPESPIETAPIEELPSWLPEEPIEAAQETPIEAAPIEELPTWLRKEPTAPPLEPFKKIVLPEEPPTWLGEEPQPSTPEPVNINMASLAELERLPGVGFILAQNLINYRENIGGITDLADLEKIPGFTSGIIHEIQDQVTVEATPTPAPTLPPSLPDEDEAVLTLARLKMGENEYNASLENYSRLVKKGYHLDTLIHELQEALYRSPLNVDILQTLGDAYLRNDNLQDALNAYTEAENLLR